jgi:hypothetical protein
MSPDPTPEPTPEPIPEPTPELIPPDEPNAPPPSVQRTLRFRIVHAIITGFATLGGAIVGFVVTLALVVAEARFGRYIFALEDLMAFRLDLLPIPLGAIAGFRLHHRRSHTVGWTTVFGLAGFFIGAIGGAVLGSIAWTDSAGPWAGAVIGAAIGLVGGCLASLKVHHRPKNALITAAGGVVAILGMFLFGVFGATNMLQIDPLEFAESTPIPVPEPARVDAVVFLLGDAGATLKNHTPLLTALQTEVEQWSASLRRDSAVSIVFLGDNVYPQGVHDREDPHFENDSLRLWSQIDLVGGPEAMKHGSVGLFVTGNHDWANTVGEAGLKQVQNMGAQLVAGREAGRYVSMVPAPGDAGPVVRDLRRNVRIAFFDTHWFLQERSTTQRTQYFERLAKALNGARDREVILVAHHPYYSAGPHGAIVPGYHTLGVAYVLKQAGALVQDLNSPPYDELLAGLRRTFESSRKPPLIYAGGHDHSLQVLTGADDADPRFVLVSGAGSKVSSLQMGPGLVWGQADPGWMMLVFRKDDGVDLFVVAGDQQYRECAGTEAAIAECMAKGRSAFKITYAASLLGPSKAPRELTPVSADTMAPDTPWWTEPVDPPAEPAPTGEDLDFAPEAVPPRILLDGSDSVIAAPGRSYPAGRLRRFLAGDLNRHLWKVPIKLPVLDLDKVGGGLRPDRLFGGKQTIGLRFRGANGLEYEFRPMVKNAGPVLPQWVRAKWIHAALNDQMAAQFPMGALVVSSLQEAAGIAAPRPVPVIMPNEPTLGRYRAVFAGRVGLLSINANEREGSRPGFGGYRTIVSSEDVLDSLAANPLSGFDDRYYLKVRLLDMLVGDWDRHMGQWRWGRRLVDGKVSWRAIPEDRDWAFSRVDGVVGSLTRWVLPKYIGFSDQLPPVERLAASGTLIDHLVLNKLVLADFAAVARELQTTLSDSVITRAVGTLPPPYLELERENLIRGLRTRRDQLAEYAEEYYRLLARDLEISGVDTTDVVEFQKVGEDQARVQVRVGPQGPVRFERLIDDVTRSVTLLIDPARDQVSGQDGLPFRVVMRKPD